MWMTRIMQVGEYVKLICTKATELSLPREWTTTAHSSDTRRSQSTIGDRKIEQCAVIGGGVMGQGIVIALIKAGFRTTLIERDEQTLAQRMADIWQTMTDEVQRGRVTKGTIANAGGLLTASTDFEALRNVDFVIEAVFENMALKQDVFKNLDRVCPPHAILCSNTSTLDIEAIARSTRRPKNVVGMHFFVPPHSNPALEVIYAEGTTCRDAVKTVVDMGRRLEKLPVIMRNAPGFVGNRMFRPYLAEAMLLLEDGFSPSEVDTAFKNFGFAIGPFQSMDFIGLDTLQRVAEQNKWQLSSILDLLADHGRLGRKTGKGFYSYKDNRRQQDEEVERLVSKVRKSHKRSSLTQEEIVRRCLYPLVNEGFDVLADKIVERPESVDAMWILAYGWPPSTGGPMYWAQKEGLANILEYMKKQKKSNSSPYHWNPSPMLERLVKSGAADLPVDQWTQKILSKL